MYVVKADAQQWLYKRLKQRAHPEGVLAPYTLIWDDALNSIVLFHHIVAYHTKMHMISISDRKMNMNNQENEYKNVHIIPRQ